MLTASTKSFAIAWLLAVSMALGCSSGTSSSDAGRDVGTSDAPGEGGAAGTGGFEFDAADSSQVSDPTCPTGNPSVRTTCIGKTATTIYLCPFRMQTATCPAGCAVEDSLGVFNPEVHCKPGPDASADGMTDSGADTSGDATLDASTDG